MELERIDPVTTLVPSKLIKTQFQEFDFPNQSYTISGRHLSIFNKPIYDGRYDMAILYCEKILTLKIINIDWKRALL